MTHECHWQTLENIFLPREATIVRAAQPTPSETHFTLRMADGRPMRFEPGQILEVSLFGYGEIPIGLASSPTREHTFDLVVRTVGRVSTAINALTRGQSLYVRGPLGRGFDLDQLRGHDVLIIAGGIGLCPTRSLIQYIVDRRREFKRFILFYGARDADNDDVRILSFEEHSGRSQIVHQLWKRCRICGIQPFGFKKCEVPRFVCSEMREAAVGSAYVGSEDILHFISPSLDLSHGKRRIAADFVSNNAF